MNIFHQIDRLEPKPKFFEITKGEAKKLKKQKLVDCPDYATKKRSKNVIGVYKGVELIRGEE